MNLNDILEIFTLVSGLKGDEVSKYLKIIINCKEYFESRVCVEDMSETDRRRLTHACAVYAYYRVSFSLGSQELSSFKAGDIQLSMTTVRADAKEMWENEMYAISDIFPTVNDNLSFIRVSV